MKVVETRRRRRRTEERKNPTLSRPQVFTHRPALNLHHPCANIRSKRGAILLGFPLTGAPPAFLLSIVPFLRS